MDFYGFGGTDAAEFNVVCGGSTPIWCGVGLGSNQGGHHRARFALQIAPPVAKRQLHRQAPFDAGQP